MTRRRRALGIATAASFVAVGSAVVGASASCNAPLIVHTFEGQQYDPIHDCLAAKDLIDVVDGKAQGTCARGSVRCYEEEVDGGGDGNVYVSTSCTGAPGFRDGTSDPETSLCGFALAAYAMGSAKACPTSA